MHTSFEAYGGLTKMIGEAEFPLQFGVLGELSMR